MLLELWLTSQKFWHDNFRSLTRKTILFPITSEQILGLNYLSLYCDFSAAQELKNLRRYYYSTKLVKAIVNAENNFFIWTKYKDSDLPYYDSNKVKSFLKLFSLSEPFSLLKLSFYTFDHILYQFYCILNDNYEYYIFEWDYKNFAIYNWFECFHLSTYDTSYAKEYQEKFSPLWCSSSELKSIFFSSFCMFHTDRVNNRASKAKKLNII